MKSVTRAGLAALTMSAALLAGCGSGDGDAAAPAAATSAAPATNGVADLPADAIAAKAAAALKAAKSFHVKGAMTDNGDVTTLDMKISGDDVIGSLEFGGAKLEMLSVAGQRYIRPNEAFWKMIDSSGATAKLMKNAVGTKWIKPSATDVSFNNFFSITNVDDMLKPTGTLSKGEAKTVEGVPAIGLVDSGDAKSTLYVATTGEPYPVKLDRPAPEGLTFSEVGATFAEIKAPAATEVIDQSALKK
jgi:hypothetical protein